jgi:YHS domain-containing protein
MKTSVIYLTAALLASCCPVQKTVEVDPVGKNSSVAEVPVKPAKPRPYPLTTCLVSGEDLDSMDERVSTVYEGQVFEFCCKPCLKKFNKDPEKYQAMLTAGKSS